MAGAVAEARTTALVTGASTGIGAAIARHLAAHGFHVVATARGVAQLAWLEAEAAAEGWHVTADQLDITDDASVAACIARAEQAGPIDVLVNNAGIGNVGAVEDGHLDEMHRIMDTNLWGTLRVTRAVLPGMRRRGAGTIVTIGSLAGRIGVPGEAAYVASKFAVNGLTETLAYEVERFGIRVALIEPGYVATTMGARTDPTRGFDRSSPYTPLLDHIFAQAESSIDTGEPPETIAACVLEAITTDRPRLRWQPGTLGPIVVEGLATMDPEEFRDQVRVHWWSEGADGPMAPVG